MWHQLRRRVGAGVSRAAAAVAGEVGRDEVHFYGALVLVAAGCWEWWRPGAFLIPGAALLWVSLPMRSAFIDRPHEPKDGKG